MRPRMPIPPVTPNFFPWNMFLLFFALCWAIMFVPFFVTDVFYAHRDTSCVDFFATPIDITLREWLEADGWIILCFLVLFITLGIIAMIRPLWGCVYVIWESLHVLFIIWRLSWLIVGAVMFWAYFNPSGLCQTSISRYMWANLIIGFFWLFIELVLAYMYPKPVPVPVSVPVGVTPSGAGAVTPNTTSLTVLRPTRRY